MKPFAYIKLLLALPLAACAEYDNLPPIASADRVVIGQFKGAQNLGTIEGPESVKKITDFVNRQRRSHWSSFQTVPGSCGAMLTFMSGATSIGYFVVYPTGHSRTQGPSGPVEGGMPKSEAAELLSLIPPALLSAVMKEAHCQAFAK